MRKQSKNSSFMFIQRKTTRTFSEVLKLNFCWIELDAFNENNLKRMLQV